MERDEWRLRNEDGRQKREGVGQVVFLEERRIYGNKEKCRVEKETEQIRLTSGLREY